MANWNLEQEEYYYKIYDSSKELAGYFQPDYGKIYPEGKEEEIIQEMLKRQDHIYGGILYVPLLKLNLSNEAAYEIDHLMANLEVAMERARKWKECIGEMPSIGSARARKSHTDPDMLAILLELKFGESVRLNNNDILKALQPFLERFAEKELL